MQKYTVNVNTYGTYWYKEGTTLFHRENGPALECSNGDKEWYLNGRLHREDGPAVEYSNGDKKWYLNGKLHREDGPARCYANGDKQWWQNDKVHRVDGPAVEYSNGYKEWWVEGKKYTEAEFNQYISKDTCDGKEVVIGGKTYKLSLVDKK